MLFKAISFVSRLILELFLFGFLAIFIAIVVFVGFYQEFLWFRVICWVVIILTILAIIIHTVLWIKQTWEEDRGKLIAIFISLGVVGACFLYLEICSKEYKKKEEKIIAIARQEGTFAIQTYFISFTNLSDEASVFIDGTLHPERPVVVEAYKKAFKIRVKEGKKTIYFKKLLIDSNTEIALKKSKNWKGDNINDQEGINDI